MEGQTSSTKRIKYEECANLGSFLADAMKTGKDIDDSVIDQCINAILENRPEAIAISSLVFKQEMLNPETKPVNRSLKKKRADWSTLVIPVHNAKDFHWSVILITRIVEKIYFIHYDSCYGMNTSSAQNIHAILESEKIIPSNTKLVNAEFFQQYGNYECGIYVILAVFSYFTFSHGPYKTYVEFRNDFEPLRVTYNKQKPRKMFTEMASFLSRFVCKENESIEIELGTFIENSDFLPHDKNCVEIDGDIIIIE